MAGGAHPSLSDLTQVATGLRNAAGMAFQPATGDLYFQDNGIDGLDRRQRTPQRRRAEPDLRLGDSAGAVEDFGFARDYIAYRTGERVAAARSSRWRPSSRSRTRRRLRERGASEIAFAPTASSAAGLGSTRASSSASTASSTRGASPTRRTRWSIYDLATGEYFHFIEQR